MTFPEFSNRLLEITRMVSFFKFGHLLKVTQATSSHYERKRNTGHRSHEEDSKNDVGHEQQCPTLYD